MRRAISLMLQWTDGVLPVYRRHSKGKKRNIGHMAYRNVCSHVTRKRNHECHKRQKKISCGLHACSISGDRNTIATVNTPSGASAFSCSICSHCQILILLPVRVAKWKDSVHIMRLQLSLSGCLTWVMPGAFELSEVITVLYWATGVATLRRKCKPIRLGIRTCM